MNDSEKIEAMTSEYINNLGNLVVEVTNEIIEPLDFIKESEKNRESYFKEIERLKNKEEFAKQAGDLE